MPRWWLWLLVVLLAGCGTSAKTLRLEAGRGEPVISLPRTGDLGPVLLDDDSFHEALETLASEVRSSERPQAAAMRLFEVSARSGSYLYEARTRRLIPEGESPVSLDLPAEDVELTRAYLRWCGRTGRSGDCLRLLVDAPTVNGDGRYALAMAIAQGSALDATAEAFRDMADPQAVLAAMLWTATVYMVRCRPWGPK